MRLAFLSALSAPLALSILPACQGPGTAPVEGPEGPFDWTLGTWTGVRRDGNDDSEGAMTMRVEPILGGAGQTRHIEIEHDGGTYRGFAVQVLDPQLGRWVRQYVNAVRGRYARYECDVAREPAVWRSASPTRTRESRLVSERPAASRWRRTMEVSEDGGETWRVLWIDELERGS